MPIKSILLLYREPVKNCKKSGNHSYLKGKAYSLVFSEHTAEMLCYKHCFGNYSNEASWAGGWLVISAWNFEKSQAIKVFILKSWIVFLTSWYHSLQGSEIFQNYAKAYCHFTSMEFPLYVGTHSELPWINSSMSILFSRGSGCGSSVLPIQRSPSRINAGQGKNSEHRDKWSSWVSSSDSWHSTLWLKSILPKGATCASKQMGNKRSLRKSTLQIPQLPLVFKAT